MRSVVIVYLDKFVKATLLLKKVKSGWLGCFLLQRQVHTFVPAILFGMTWLDALNSNTQSQPPHCKPAQSKQGMG